MADEQDPIAAMKNSKAREEAESEGRSFNYTDAFDTPDAQGVLGPDPDKRRAGAGEGIRAPFAQDTGGQSQTSVFDGKGNETVVTFGTNADGQHEDGSGRNVADAHEEVEADDVPAGRTEGNPSKD